MRFFFLITLFALTLPGTASANTINHNLINKAEEYLQTLNTAKADFIQKSSTGSRLSGVFYLDRPGKLRFEYNEVDDFIVADGFLIYFYDAELGEQTNAPIGHTLADFILRDDLTLREDLTVTETTGDDRHHYLTLVQTDDPAAGYLELVFSKVPFALKKWRVTDAQGAVTEIELKNLKYDVNLDSELFAYYKPKDPSRRYND